MIDTRSRSVKADYSGLAVATVTICNTQFPTKRATHGATSMRDHIYDHIGHFRAQASDFPILTFQKLPSAFWTTMQICHFSAFVTGCRPKGRLSISARLAYLSRLLLADVRTSLSSKHERPAYTSDLGCVHWLFIGDPILLLETIKKAKE